MKRFSASKKIPPAGEPQAKDHNELYAFPDPAEIKAEQTHPSLAGQARAAQSDAWLHKNYLMPIAGAKDARVVLRGSKTFGCSTSSIRIVVKTIGDAGGREIYSTGLTALRQDYEELAEGL